MNTFSKELKITIGMVSVCLGVAFVALVALFTRAGGLDKLGTSVLMLVLVAFVAVGSAVIVDEYKNEERAQIARTTWYELNAVREMRDEYADTLESAYADYRDECYNTKRLSAEVQELRNVKREHLTKLTYQRQCLDELRAQRDELTEQLDELRYTFKAERERIADI